MSKKQISKRLLDYSIEWVCETSSIAANYSKHLNKCLPWEIITGETSEKINYLNFGPYDWITFRSKLGMGPVNMVRWLGVSCLLSHIMSYKILP